jgi:hypothetical protein
LSLAALTERFQHGVVRELTVPVGLTASSP